MNKPISCLFLFAVLSTAQTSVTITIPIHPAALPILEAYRTKAAAACGRKDAVGVCIQFRWDTVRAMLQDSATSTDAVKALIQAARQWAIDTNDASLPTALKNAVAAQAAAKAVIDASVPVTATATVQ